MTAPAPSAPWSSVPALAERPSADVIIIGGGINGIATFRDLALQGVDVILVERDDFVSGASAASSHMIHGGIRYLENGEFRLVHEAVIERNDLLATAPHYVRPLRTTIPIFSVFSGILGAPLRFLRHGAGRPTERGALLIKIGLVIYDTFSRGNGAVPRHEFLGRRRSLAALPDLDPRVRCTATYWDASVRDPERLAIDVLRDALRIGGDRARAANYAGVVAADADGVTVRDTDTGDEVRLTAPVIVNATGPWVDVTNDRLGHPTQAMGGTKGSHIVVDHPELLRATDGRELFFEGADGRIVLIYPLHGRVMIGTTDLEHDIASPAVCTDDEVDYFIDLVSHVLPEITVDRSQIVFAFSGVRPLPAHGSVAAGFVSRDYSIRTHALGETTLLSLVGGKWTTFRASAEAVADRALAALGRRRRARTQGRPIGGGEGFPRTPDAVAAWAREHGRGLPTERVATLLDRYGTVAAHVIEAIALADADEALSTLPGYSVAELRHLARTEHVRHLDDLVMRRTSVAFVGHATTPALTEIAQAIAPTLGWSAADIEREVGRAEARVGAASAFTVPSASTPGERAPRRAPARG